MLWIRMKCKQKTPVKNRVDKTEISASSGVIKHQNVINQICAVTVYVIQILVNSQQKELIKNRYNGNICIFSWIIPKDEDLI